MLIAEGLSPIASTALFDLDLAGRGHGYLIALAVDPAKSHEAKRMPHSGSATGGKGGKRGTWQNRDGRIERLLGKKGLHVSYPHEYVKIDGTWMIVKTGCVWIFEDIQPRAAGSRLRTRWDTNRK